MGTQLGDPALIQHSYLVRIADRGKTVGDDQSGTASGQGIDGGLHRVFGVGVEGTGGLIQNEHSGLP